MEQTNQNSKNLKKRNESGHCAGERRGSITVSKSVPFHWPENTFLEGDMEKLLHHCIPLKFFLIK